jgi:uncharacterized membrane protein YhhN
MTAAGWAILGAAGVLALADWVAVSDRSRTQRLELIVKPATTLAFIALAIAIHPTHPAERSWFVAALVFCLAGDVFLMLPREAFLPGLTSFLLGHIGFIAGLSLDIEAARLAVSIPIVGLAALLLGARLIRGARAGGHANLVGPLVAYVTVIATMASFALATGNAWAGAGALLFMTSDAINGWGRFIGELPHERLLIMVTYHAALAGLVISLTR